MTGRGPTRFPTQSPQSPWVTARALKLGTDRVATQLQPGLGGASGATSSGPLSVLAQSDLQENEAHGHDESHPDQPQGEHRAGTAAHERAAESPGHNQPAG